MTNAIRIAYRVARTVNMIDAVGLVSVRVSGWIRRRMSRSTTITNPIHAAANNAYRRGQGSLLSAVVSEDTHHHRMHVARGVGSRDGLPGSSTPPRSPSGP